MVVYLDFDGTVVEHAYPATGMINPGGYQVISKLQQAGHRIILNTYRANIGPSALQPAITLLTVHSWMLSNNPNTPLLSLEGWESSKIPPAPWDPGQATLEGVLFIDDIALGTPLIPGTMNPNLPMVDWAAIDNQLDQFGFYSKNKIK